MNWPKEWEGKTWRTYARGRTVFITEDDLRRVFEVIRSDVPNQRDCLIDVFDETQGLSDRRIDRSLQLLKSKGLIKHVRYQGLIPRWQAVEAGGAA